MKLERLNPDTLYSNPAFTQVITVSKPSKWIYVGGQNGVNKKGEIEADLGKQSVQALKNVIAALKAADATLENVVKLSIYLVQGNSINDAFAAVQHLLKDVPPATVTGFHVVGLAFPGALIEIEAVAVI